MKKRVIGLILVFAMIIAAMSGCGKEQSNNKVSKTDTIDFNETGYPIVNEPLTLTIGVLKDASYQAPWEDLEWVKKLEAASGINLEFVVYSGAEAVELMFAGEDFPDITFNAGTTQQIYDAAQAGFVYALDEYMEEYAPNWNNYFASNKTALKKVTLPDGHIYSFPMVREEAYHYQIRDLWQINKTWLDELGLSVPKTTDEFYNVLKTIKANAGKGSIPANVMPYYLNGLMSHVGGAMDLVGSYGLRVSTENYYVTVDDNGKVEFNFANEAIKEPIKFINKLAKEELIPLSCFTTTFSTYSAQIMSDNKSAACFHAYYNLSTPEFEYVNFGPLESGNGKTPIMRSQANAVTPNYFTVYSKCQYPEVAVRLANMIADPEWSVQGTYGMLEEDSSLYKDEEGKYVARAGLNGYDLNVEVPSFRIPCLISEDVFNTIKFEDTSNRYQRQVAVEGVYKGKTIPQENLYPFISFSDENMAEISELNYEIVKYVRQTLNDWAVNGNIDANWDDYVNQLNKLGLERYLELLQEELDAYNKK